LLAVRPIAVSGPALNAFVSRVGWDRFSPSGYAGTVLRTTIAARPGRFRNRVAADRYPRHSPRCRLIGAPVAGILGYAVDRDAGRHNSA